MKEVAIERIAVPWDMQYVYVILKEKQTHRRIPIGVGCMEGAALIGGLEKLTFPRPMTHDLLVTFLETLRGTVRHVVMTKVDEEKKTYHATIVIESNGSTYEIDARPSDSLMLAVRQNTPVFAEEIVLNLLEKHDLSGFDRLATIWPVSSDSSYKPIESPQINN